MRVITIATVATALLLLVSMALATGDQYLYSLDQVDWDTGKAAYPAAASGQPTAVLDARSDIECATLCEADSHSCVSAAWCPAEPAGKCRLLGDTADASVMAAGCRILSLTSRRRVSGGWCPWNSWTTWSAVCHTGVRVRRRSCQCPRPQAPATGANCEDGSADGGDSQSDQRFMGWCGWQSWTSWGSGCNKNQQRTRERSCSCITDPVATPSTEASQTASRFMGWCGWQGWSSWGSGCNVNQQRNRVRTCSCITGSVPTPSTVASQSATRFIGWCGWKPWSSWSGWYGSNCVTLWKRKKRTRTRYCTCTVGYTSSPSSSSSQTDETSCTFNG